MGAALLAACSASAGGGDDDPGAPDARTGGAIDGAPGGGGDGGGGDDCLPQVPGNYGIPTPVDSSQFEGEGDYYVMIELVEEPFQRMFVTLHQGMGVFAGAVEPGTYVIEGDETDFSWCGACVYLAVDDGDTPSTQYMARSGKVTIDSVGAEVHGEITAVELRQIEHVYSGPECPGDGEWPCGNNACSEGHCAIQDEVGTCETSVASLAF